MISDSFVRDEIPLNVKLFVTYVWASHTFFNHNHLWQNDLAMILDVVNFQQPFTLSLLPLTGSPEPWIRSRRWMRPMFARRKRERNVLRFDTAQGNFYTIQLSLITEGKLKYCSTIFETKIHRHTNIILYINGLFLFSLDLAIRNSA